VAAEGTNGVLGPGDFEALVGSAVSPFVLIDLTGTIRWVGASITELTGWEVDELVGRNMLEFLDEPSQVAVIDAFARFVETSASGPAWLGTGIPIGVLCKSGEIVLCVASSATEARTGVPGVIAIQLFRGAAHRHLHRAVRAMATGEPLEAVLVHLADMVASEIAGATVEIGWAWDGDAFAGITGNAGGILARDDGSPGERPWAAAMSTADSVATEAIDALPAPIAAAATAAGTTGCWVHPLAVVPGERPTAAVVVWRHQEIDATTFNAQYLDRGVDLAALALQWARGHDSLEREARIDSLTGLANRRSFFERLREATPAGEPGTVLFCDLDRFKPVNDRHGHTVGDRVLVILGERLQRSVRPTDLVARYGGDEFTVLCPGLTDPEEIANLTERLRRATADPVRVGEATVEVGITIGSAPLAPGADADEVVTAAADAMRAAKRGR